MAVYTTKLIDNKSEWEKFVLSRKPQSFLQSWNWGETNKSVGSGIYRLGFLRNNQLVGAAQIIEERAKRGPYFLIPGGPLIDWSDKEAVYACVHSIVQLATEKKVWFARIRPEILENTQNRQLLKKSGFVSSPMHLSAENTWVLDITPGLDEILSNMRKNTRYSIRQSLQKSLVFEEYKNPDGAQILYDLQRETAERHKFVPFPQKLFETQLEYFRKDKQGGLFVCKKENEILAAAIIIFYGEIAYYHHSASTSKYKELPFSYFLQWNIIQEARKRGCKKYNFWGIAPTDNPKHRFAGVTTFKKGFGGERIDWIHAQDIPVSPLYWATHYFELVRKHMRRL